MPSRCCEFVDSRLRRSPPDRASAVPMDKPGKTQCVSPTLPTGRRLPHKLHSTPQQHEMILISGNGEISSRLHAFSLFFPGSCPNNRDRRRTWGVEAKQRTLCDERKQRDDWCRRASGGDFCWSRNFRSSAAVRRFRSDTKGGEAVDERRGVAQANPRTDDFARRSEGTKLA